ncbi:hypothetical protein FOMPIDRAFT_70665 [Fomitopsis schrenkii]|uniref:CAP-Gly domain-containing protein n=1 Tax=Fomitopsis schrenkii TaxID=2126942 RepID=S8ECZ9_FOMSC|nr:hypothetical protein FOMPIDRAFT_70665 [Fomitopsis schrenkii]
MSSAVNVFVVSPDTRSERRYDLHITVQQLKNKLELVTGIPVQNQAISVFNTEGDTAPAAVLDDDSKPLGFYGLKELQILQVSDLNPSTSFTGQLTDVSQVEKFELSEGEYAQRRDTILAYKQQHKIGRFAEQKDEAEEKVPEDITVGARCEVETQEDDLHKRGTVRFVGPTHFAKGIWVGIEYDEPMGKNNGSVKGDQYFECKPNFGVFVKPERVKIGDFPVEEINFDDEEM